MKVSKNEYYKSIILLIIKCYTYYTIIFRTCKITENDIDDKSGKMWRFTGKLPVIMKLSIKLILYYGNLFKACKITKNASIGKLIKTWR